MPILAGGINLFLISKLDTKGGKPAIKNIFLAKLIQVIGSYNLYDIWRNRNLVTGLSNFRPKHFLNKNHFYFQ